MKLRTAILVFGLIIISMGDVYGADWKLFSSSIICDHYYDRQSITSSSKKVVRLWAKRVFSEKGVADMVKDFGEKYKVLNHSIELFELNCIEKKFSIIKSIYRSNDGVVISSVSGESSGDDIPPESVVEFLYKEICK